MGRRHRAGVAEQDGGAALLRHHGPGLEDEVAQRVARHQQGQQRLHGPRRDVHARYSGRSGAGFSSRSAFGAGAESGAGSPLAPKRARRARAAASASTSSR